MTKDTSTSKNLFDTLYAAGQDVIDAARKPLAERQLRRKFQTAYDNAATAKLEAEVRVQELQENLKSYSLESVLRYKQEIADQEFTMAAIATHYEEMFGEPLVK